MLLRFSDYKWAEALRNAGFQQYQSQVRLSDGSRANLWIAPDAIEQYKDATPETMRTAFERWLSTSEPGGNPIDDAAPL